MARIVTTGFGADNDTYLMLGTWDRLIHHGTYSPSRFQGSPLAELSIGALSEVGGHWLSAAMSIALAALAVLSLFDLAKRRLGSRSDAALLAAILALTPVFLVAASTSHDYIYGLALFLAGWNVQERGHDQRLVAVILAMATLGRFSYVPLGAVVLLAGPPPRGRRERATSTAVYALVIAVGYLPAFLSADRSFNIFTADRPTGQGLVGLIGRAVVKPTLLFGVLGMALLAVVIVAAVGPRARRRERDVGRAMVARDDRDQRGHVGVDPGRGVVPAPHVGDRARVAGSRRGGAGSFGPS